ncbi:MAG TPA: 3'-5' exonuclease [Thermoanaerobaculales bacterium]|nr:3'-5' exonuclease [Thermoanaerobaculales bacterium]HPA80334.1 3'-5' exonuclease [Thermoanaerobaculales bacterium]HQL28609.1 3'-5' exonuclease [Thermoanaerobaculales bacterium]HQN97359.1 3'-5' exonuclease [Thermoanaerobaculales bacterium]
MTGLLDDLNDPQRAAVTHGEGPLLVLAGAGSGKTRVLTYRIAHLVEQRVAAPHEITAVTFTNKAAREMAERVARLVGGTLDGGFVGTFHRWALELLRRHPEAAGLPRHFAIVDADEQRALVGRVLKELKLDPTDHPPRSVLARFSREVNRCQDPSTLGARAGDEVTPQVWERYRRLKAAAGVVDFDDMLTRALELLRSQLQVLEAARRRGRWLLVDEFQDTNRLQMELLVAVVGGTGNITAVGDEDQSIYGWRGAELQNILSFERHFPGARVVALEQNYRSSRPILDAAGGLIARNAARRGKRLFTRRPGGDPVRVYVGEDERAEARWAADRIEELGRSRSLGELAVLVRTNAQTRPFEEELTRRRIAHRVVGGLRFWQRKEVRDALAYLRLVVRADDVLAFERVVNVPARGIGSATLDVLERHAAATGLALPAAARQLPDALARRARMALAGFFGVLDEASAQRELLDPGDFVGWLLEASGLLALVDGDDEERVARRENLQQLAAAVAEAAARGQDLADFLDAVALLEEGDEEAAADAVSLMTLHAAKGLEFDAVFLAGLEDGLLPHANSRDDPDRLEEERRLAYVGITRARHWLALTAARSRFLFGSRAPSRPSRFLLELPAAGLLDVSDVALPLAAPDRRDSNGEVPQPASAARRPRPARPAAATVTDASGQGWRPGNRVRHSSFGTGVVLACQGRGDNLKLVVYFDRAGRKTLVPTIARLERL